MIVDSVVWIALKYKRDKYHELTQDIIPSLFGNQTLFVTDYVINEVYAFLLRKSTQLLVTETLDMFVTSENIEIIYNNEETYLKSLKIVRKHPFLSIVDANILLHSRDMDINYLTFENRMKNLDG